MPMLALDVLEPHPDNANIMSPAFQKKLAAHIRATGDYPPLIVRRHPSMTDRFQILDGHHRALALRELGHEQARCEIWEADDDRAAVLLLSLNRLHGEDDPLRRGALLERLASGMGIDQLAEVLPDTTQQIQALIDLSSHPPPLAEPPPVQEMPHAITFFLTSAQRDRLADKLDAISRDRSAALVALLDLHSIAEEAQS